MTSRERVIAAFGFRKPDRIPRYEIFLPNYVRDWKARHSPDTDRWIYDHYDRIDIGTVLADQHGPFYSRRGIEWRQGTTYHERDSWGRLLLKKDDAYFEQDLEAALSTKGMLDTEHFESPLAPERWDWTRDLASSRLRKFGLVSGVLGLFMGSQRLRGDVQFLTDLAEDPVFARALVDRLEPFTTAVGLRVAKLTDTQDTALWLYDEFSSRTDPMFSPRTFERIFLEPYARMIAAWKAGGIRHVILHCDGNSLPLMPLLIQAGFTGLQSLAPTAGMYLPEVRKRYPGFVLVGGMCNIHTLATGTKAEIERQAREVAEAGREGGVVIGTHSIDEDIPVGNYDHYCSVLERCDEKW